MRKHTIFLISMVISMALGSSAFADTLSGTVTNNTDVNFYVYDSFSESGFYNGGFESTPAHSSTPFSVWPNARNHFASDDEFVRYTATDGSMLCIYDYYYNNPPATSLPTIKIAPQSSPGCKIRPGSYDLILDRN